MPLSLHPRLPELPELEPGVAISDQSVSREYMEQFYSRFHVYHRELVGALAMCEPITGKWTPTFTFATAGDLNIAYSVQVGSYTRVGTLVEADYTIVTSAFTWTTSAGSAFIQGLPVVSVNEANQIWVGKAIWQGITFSASSAGSTEIFTQLLPNTSQLKIDASGSGINAPNLVAADFPSGGTVVLRGSIIYRCPP